MTKKLAPPTEITIRFDAPAAGQMTTTGALVIKRGTLAQMSEVKFSNALQLAQHLMDANLALKQIERNPPKLATDPTPTPKQAAPPDKQMQAPEAESEAVEEAAGGEEGAEGDDGYDPLSVIGEIPKPVTIAEPVRFVGKTESGQLALF